MGSEYAVWTTDGWKVREGIPIFSGNLQPGRRRRCRMIGFLESGTVSAGKIVFVEDRIAGIAAIGLALSPKNRGTQWVIELTQWLTRITGTR
jgi:hypothetical protein